MPLTLSRKERIRLYWLRDHGALRALWHNFHRLDPEVWRHNHPSPRRLEQLHAMGAASILSLRGAGLKINQMEAAHCADLGMTYRAIGLSATKLPAREDLAALLEALRTLPRPLVIHCKSGSDRTGLASTLYLHVLKGVPLTQARQQLALRYLHNRHGAAGIVHRLLDAYAGQNTDFDTWLRDTYDPTRL